VLILNHLCQGRRRGKKKKKEKGSRQEKKKWKAKRHRKNRGVGYANAGRTSQFSGQTTASPKASGKRKEKAPLS